MSTSPSSSGLKHPRYWLSWFGLFLLSIIGRMPHRLIIGFGKLVGLFAYLFALRRRCICEINIRHCFPELEKKAVKKLVYKTMVDQGIGLIETISGWFKNPISLKDRVSVEGLEYLEQAKSEKRGVLLVGCHFTTLDFAGTLFTNFSDMDVVYRRNNNPVLDLFLTKARSRCGDPIEKKQLKKLIKRLRGGHVVWYAPDQDYGTKNAVFVPFFGIQAATVTGTSTIAKMTGARVLMIRHYRENKGCHYRIEILPVNNFPSGDIVKDTAHINMLIEEGVRKAPEQYMWVHRRFKHRPLGERALY